MSVSTLEEQLFTGIYALARKLGLLKLHAGQALFSNAYFLYKRLIEDPFDALTRRHPELFRGGNVLDIGANIGYTPAVFARAIEAPYRVYAFEPEEFNFRLLERFAKSRKAPDGIVPVNAAAGDRDGTADLWCNESHHGDHRIVTNGFRASGADSAIVPVRMLKIDTFVDEMPKDFPVCFIKIDVQGYELPVCRGMERTLDRNPGAAVALEYTPEGMRALGFEPQELLGWLAERNYHASRVEKDGVLRAANCDQLNEQPYANLLFTRSAAAGAVERRT